MIEKFFTLRFPTEFAELCSLNSCSGFGVVLIGILVGGAYWIKFGISYSCLISEDDQKAKTSFFGKIPGRKYIDQLFMLPWKFIAPTRLGKYLSGIYAAPVESEQVLGGFFFGKTLITSAIAFYYVDNFTLIALLTFSAVFDSLTGIYQQTLMNYFHQSVFKNRCLQFIQNLGKRYLIDVFRAEVLTLILLGMNTFTFSEQFHVLQNRFVSASYYFNALIIDKLVDMGAISREFRSKFVIFASTAGGLLCLLDFAKTDFPSWISAETVASIPSWVPGPLKMLAYFNLSVFLVAAILYVWTVYSQKLIAFINLNSSENLYKLVPDNQNQNS